MKGRIDISPAQRETVQNILRAHLPPDVHVWAFGSRAAWTAKDFSDLDLALEGAEPVSAETLLDLETAFEESALPWKVDVIDLHRITPEFRAVVEAGKVRLSIDSGKDLCKSVPELRKMKISEIMDFNPTTKIENSTEKTTAPFIEMAALPIDNRYIPNVGKKSALGSGAKFVDGDTLFARITPCLENGKGGFVSGLGQGVVGRGSTEFIVFRACQDTDQNFVYYLSRNPEFRQFAIKGMSGSSGRQRVSWQTLADFRIACLPPMERQTIGKILTALDDKIEANRRMNETLEAMARALFKSWFVDFDPVHAKAKGQTPTQISKKTATLFPDTFNENGLPMGWEVKPLDKIAEFLNGLALQKFPADGEDYLPVIKISELRNGITSKSNKASIDIPGKYIIEDGDVLFSWSGSLLQCIWTGGRGALNQHLFKVSSDNVPKWFHYLWVDHHLATFQMIAASKATTMGHIQRHHLAEADVNIPHGGVMKTADEILSPMFQRMLNNDLESKTLANLRDTLLPKLMSGEIRVRDAEKKWRP